MSDKTTIEWTDATWNPITGCTVVSEGCRNCYAAELAATRLKNHPSRSGLARRNKAGVAQFTGDVRFNEAWLDQPMRWQKPRRIFVCAHGDLFHESVPDEWIDRVFAVMAQAQQHTFQVLTKRPERMRSYLSMFRAHPVPNVWLGVSIEDQETADERIPLLLGTPAAKRFISAEPLLGQIDLKQLRRENGSEVTTISALAGTWQIIDGDEYHGGHENKLDWVIVGGESGPNARPMHPEWVRSLRDQCAAANVPFFFKQWGEWIGVDTTWNGSNEWMIFDRHGNMDIPDHRWPDETAAEVAIIKVGKKAAGALLDGVMHREFPK